MSRDDDKEPEEAMRDSVRRRKEQISRFEKSRPQSIAEYLSLIGSLGWLVIAPILIGIFVGRWLDRLMGLQIFWSATLVLVGAVAGSWLAWKKVQSE